jgi:hypothetical protein
MVKENKKLSGFYGLLLDFSVFVFFKKNYNQPVFGEPNKLGLTNFIGFHRYLNTWFVDDKKTRALN